MSPEYVLHVGFDDILSFRCAFVERVVAINGGDLVLICSQQQQQQLLVIAADLLLKCAGCITCV